MTCRFIITVYMLALSAGLAAAQSLPLGTWETPQVIATGIAQSALQAADMDASSDDTWIIGYVGAYASDATDSTHTKLLRRRSADGGKTWSSPKPMNPGRSSETVIDYIPSIAVSEQETWICIWTDSNGSRWISRSVDNGKTWSIPSMSTIGGSIGALGSGRWLAAWNNFGIVASTSTDNGVTWSGPISVQENSTSGDCFTNTQPCSRTSFSDATVISTPNAGAAFVGYFTSYQSRSGGTPLFSLSEYTNASSTTNGGIYFSPAGGSTVMATDAHGTWLSIKQSRHRIYQAPTPWYISLSRAEGNSDDFEEISLDRSSTRRYELGTVAMDHMGNAVRAFPVTVTSGTSTMASVQVAESSNAGLTWSNEYAFQFPQEGGAPVLSTFKIYASPRGRFLATWCSNLGDGTYTRYVSRLTTEAADAKDWQLFL